MNDKILILVYVPSIESELDFYIPINKKIGTIKLALINFINSKYGDKIDSDANLVMYNKKTGQIYDDNIFVKDSDLENGVKILLI